MSTVSSVSSAAAPYSAANVSSAAASRVPQKVLGQDDFLKLLAVQFQAQDPMKPMEDTAFIAQMAQFSSLEQSSALVKEMGELRTDQKIATANSYIGRHVTVDGGNDQTVSGEVSGVDVSTGEPRLIVGEYTYALSSVLLVEPGATKSTPTQPVTPGA